MSGGFPNAKPQLHSWVSRMLSACLGPDVVNASSTRSCLGKARLLALWAAMAWLCLRRSPFLRCVSILTVLRQGAVRLWQPCYAEYAERGVVGEVVKAVLQGVRWLQRPGRLLLPSSSPAAGLGCSGHVVFPQPELRSQKSAFCPLGCSGVPSCEYGQ